MEMTDNIENLALANEIAAEGMVLLENRNRSLPLPENCRVAFLGRGQLEFSQGGTGSASVNCFLQDTLASVLSDVNCPLKADEELLKAYQDNPAFIPSVEMLNSASERCEAACVIIARNAGEGTDRQDVPGDFRLSKEETALLDALGKSTFKRVVVIVNSGGLTELGWFGKYRNFGALLLAWQSGMAGLRALVDILTGRSNPSGHLTDSVAESYMDWPSAAEFNLYRRRLEYSEDVYVGYRYFETLPEMSSKVLYPFGYGLSYSSFEIQSEDFLCDGSNVTLHGIVKNTGSCIGKEVVQCYAQAPGKNRPALELCAFCKTEALPPGGQTEFELSFPFEYLRRFDDVGDIGHVPGSFLLEAGTYRFFIGNSVRSLVECGAYDMDSMRILETPGNLFLSQPAKRLRADGVIVASGSRAIEEKEEPICLSGRASGKIMLTQVAQGDFTLGEFVSQMTPDELVSLCHGQPPARPNCTGGIGGLARYGVPTLQTADGPAGIRSGMPASCFPCLTALACTWNPELATRMGKAIAEEGVKAELDVLLAPGLNIHRNPLNGRNFEYFSEDPLVSGKMAAAFVRGVQSAGMSATIKHFACNSRENTRRLCDCIISDRCLREIYLRGFEIAVKEGKPDCVMSSYNLINGCHASASAALLTKILRDEWKFDGVVMTDWMSIESLWKELLAGNDLKMPCITQAEAEYTARMDVDMDRVPVVSRCVMERSAMRILKLILKSRRFREHLPLKCSLIPREGGRLGTSEVVALSHSGIGIAPSTDPGEGAFMLCRIKQNYWKNETALFFRLSFDKAGKYLIRVRLATPAETLVIHVFQDGREAGILPIQPTFGAGSGVCSDSALWNCWNTMGDIPIRAEARVTTELKLRFDDPRQIGCAFHYLEIIPADGEF